MQVFCPRICISSTRGGGGKTLLALGLARALTHKGVAVKPFKKGPDYIDAAWLSLASGKNATNLDPYFLDGNALRQLFLEEMASFMRSSTGYIGLIEGNRGLYDGLDERGSCSTATVARALECPIILCVDCTKSTRTVAAVLQGIACFEKDLLFGGVVLNNVSRTRHESIARRAIEENTDFRVLGVLAKFPSNPLPERHMGLQAKDDVHEAQSVLDKLAGLVAANCDLDEIWKVANEAPDLDDEPMCVGKNYEELFVQPDRPVENVERPVIGYVHDAALWFYYPENLAALEASGASLARLSLFDTHEDSAWNHLDGLYLGGGFPEDKAGEIALSPIMAKIAAYAEDWLPIYAECGGLLCLCASLEVNRHPWPMADVFPYKARFTPRPCGLGYIEAEVSGDNPFFTRGLIFRGHEFHYSCLDMDIPEPDFKLKLWKGTGISRPEDALHGMDGLCHKNVWAAFTHVFAPAVPCWARNFVAAAQKYQSGLRESFIARQRCGIFKSGKHDKIHT